MEDGEPRLERVEYDIEATVSALERSGLRQEIIQPLARVLRTGRPRKHPKSFLRGKADRDVSR